MRNFLSILAAVVLVAMSIAVIGGVAVSAQPAGSIAGFVYDDNATAISPVAHVVAYDWDGVFVDETYTAVNGSYSITGLSSGSYRVKAEAVGFLAEYWQESATVGSADPVVVTDPNATTGINFTLTAGSYISGTVYQEDGTTPLGQVARIQVYDNATGTFVAEGYSNLTTGAYSVTTGTGDGTYKLRARAAGREAEYYDNVTTFGAATPVSVTAGDETPGIDFSLAETGFISGHVQKAAGGGAITTAHVVAYDDTGTVIGDGNTGAFDLGYYYINLDPGSYRIRADAAGYMTQWWDNVTVASGEEPLSLSYWNAATPVTVTDNETPEINFNLFTPQAVTTDPATYITYNSAQLNGDLASLGTADNVTVSFVWGTAEGGPYPNATDNQTMTAPGTFYFDLGSLTSGTTYYFMAKAVGDETTFGAEKSFTISTLPPEVATGSAGQVTTNSATLNGDLTSMGTAASVNVSFEWGLTDSYGNVTADVARTGTGSFSADITGLTDNTTYHFRAKADGGGAPVYGEDNAFTTASAALLSVTTDGATSVTTTSATLNGTLTSLGAADNVTVSFIWGTTAGGPYPNVTDNQTLTNTGAFSADLSGLAPGTAYYYKAKAVGADTVYGNEVSLTTSTTPPTVTTSAATSLAATSATLNGNLTALGTAASVNVSFEWGTSTSYGSETTAQSATAIGAFTANLTGLTANTTYHVRAKAVGHGAAVYGDDITFTTPSLPDTTAPTISAVASTGITKTGATITWTTNEAATSRVEYGLTEEYGSFTTLDTSLVTGHSVELTGLKAGKTYHYRVISGDASDNEALSGDNTFKTSSKSGGMPVWGWVLIGLAVVAVAGAAAFLLRGKLQKS